MNKLSVFCFIFLLVFCGSAWAESGLKGDFEGWISEDHQPIDFCFLVNSEYTTEELLFGTCDDSSKVKLDLVPGGTPTDDPDKILFDLYFFQDLKAYNIFFTENGHEAEWNLFVKIDCTLKFTLLGGAVPGEGGSLRLCKDEVELFDIVDNAASALVADRYTIKYVPAPKKSDVPAEVEYVFQPGWNLLHFPMVVYDKESNESWKALDALPRLTLSGRSYVQGGEIRCGEAFWVFHNGPNSYSLTVLGYEPLRKDWSASKNGWNFTGAKNDTTTNDIYKWANGQYQTSSSSDSSQGHWIYKKYNVFLGVQ